MLETHTNAKFCLMTLFIIFSLLCSLLYNHCLLLPSVKGQASQGFIGFIFILIFGAHDTRFILLSVASEHKKFTRLFSRSVSAEAFSTISFHYLNFKFLSSNAFHPLEIQSLRGIVHPAPVISVIWLRDVNHRFCSCISPF